MLIHLPTYFITSAIVMLVHKIKKIDKVKYFEANVLPLRQLPQVYHYCYFIKINISQLRFTL